MSRSTRVVLLCVMSSICVPVPAQQPPESYAVHGVVEDRLTNQPIARALVEEQSSGEAVLTDNEGRFEMNLPAGTATFTARRPGYRSSDQLRMISASGSAAESQLFLTPQAVITGHVELSTGEPAEGIQIQVFRSQMHKGMRSWQPSSVAQTNSEGQFRIANLPAPGFYLLLSAPFPEADLRSNIQRPKSGYSEVYYPAGAEQASSGGVSLAPGQQVVADIVLTRERFYPVSIKVEGSGDGRFVSVELHDENGRGYFQGRFDQQKGNFEADLPGGRYSVDGQSQGKTNRYGRIDFSVPSYSSKGLKLSLLPLLPVAVRVHKDASFANTGSSGQTSGGAGANPGLSLSLEPVDGSGGGSGNLQPIPGSADNSILQIEGVRPGRYWVRAFPYEGYISAISSGGTDLAATPFVVGDGSTTTAIDVTLRNDGGQISGHLGAKAAGNESQDEHGTAFVYAIPQFNAAVPFVQSNSQVPGDYTISSLAPGTYSVMAVNQPVELDTLAPELLERLKNKATTINVDAKGSAVATLEVIDAEAELAGSGAAEPR